MGNQLTSAHDPNVAFFRKIGIGLVLLSAAAGSVSFAGPFDAQAQRETPAVPRTEEARWFEQQVEGIFKQLGRSVARREIFEAIEEPLPDPRLQVSRR